MDWHYRKDRSCCSHGDHHKKRHHDCGCRKHRDYGYSYGYDRKDDRDYGYDKKRHDHHDCSCKHGSKSVIIQCPCGDCFEVKRPHCGPCSHLFKHHARKFHHDSW